MFKFCNSCDGVYDSLDVRFTKTCDNNCAFCIERNGINSLGLTNVEKMIDSTIKSGIKSILILGGEPFLQPSKLLEYVQGIRKHVDTIYITTSLPDAINKEFDTFLQIFDLIDGLNVSVHSTDWKKNNEVFKAASNHNRLELLKKLHDVEFANNKAELNRTGDYNRVSFKIRVSITLSKGTIDSLDALINTLNYLYYPVGCKNVKINELQHCSDLFISLENICGIKLPSPYSHGCQTNLTDNDIVVKGGWLYRNCKWTFRRDGKFNEHMSKIFDSWLPMNITLKRSCFLTEPSLKASWRDLLKTIFSYFRKPTNKFRVMYENGEIKNGWETKQKENKKC